MTSLKINTLVFQHLKKVTPNLASEFKSRHKCFSIDLNITLEEILKIVVYEHMLNVTPELAKKFHRKHMAIKFQVITLSEEEIVDVTSGSESSSSESDVDSDIANHTICEDVIPLKNQVITLSEKEIIDVTSNSESSSCESDSDSEIDSNHNILENVIPPKSCEAATISLKEIIDVSSDSDSSSSDSDSEIDADAEIFVLKEVKLSKNLESEKYDVYSENNKPRPTNNFIFKSQPETKYHDNVLDAKLHEYHHISESSTYTGLQKILKEDSVVDKIVLHILNQDIMISKLNLDHVVLSKRSIPEGVKQGSFSLKDNNNIISNWNKLVSDLDISNPEETFKMFVTKQSSKDDKRKANVLGLYLSQGMQKLRLAADVFHHSKKKILNFVTGKISPDEHKCIMEYMSKHDESPHVFSDLAKVLNRSHSDAIRRYYHIRKDNSLKKGSYTMLENKICISEVMEQSNIKTVLEIENITVKENGKVDKNTLIEIAKKLGRPVQSVMNHWDYQLKPLLLQFHAGTVNFDVRRILVNHLLDKNLVNMQQLLSNPQFAGHTKFSLRRLFNKLMWLTQQKHNCKREEVTIRQVADYANEKCNAQSTKLSGKKAFENQEIVAHYKDLLDSSG